MVERFDRVVFLTQDMEAAVGEYAALLGFEPMRFNTDVGSAAWWGLGNTVIELLESADSQARIGGLVLAAPAVADPEQECSNALNLQLLLSNGLRTAQFRRDNPAAVCDLLRVDHVVLRTDDAPSCIALFRDQLGIRLALDKDAPQWGGRMLFFRAGKMTLEVIHSEADESRGNYFWGVAYQCDDLLQLCGALQGRGVAVSEIRDGRKPGTRVATVKSHCLGIPTLLIEAA